MAYGLRQKINAFLIERDKKKCGCVSYLQVIILIRLCPLAFCFTAGSGCREGRGVLSIRLDDFNFYQEGCVSKAMQYFTCLLSSRILNKIVKNVIRWNPY